jgi:translocation protein SEC63
MGIALPKFLVEEGYGKYTLIFYLALLGIFLPYVAGKWWYGTQKTTKDGIYVNSAGTLVREYKEDMSEGDIITTVSGGEEFNELWNEDEADVSLARIESKILAEGELSQYAGGLSLSDKTKLLDMSEEDRRKVLALLWAYLGRVDLGDEKTNKQKFSVAPSAWLLNDALSVIALPFQSMKPLVSSLRTSQNIIQAIAPGGSPLLQLPYFTNKVVQAAQGTTRGHMTVQEFMSQPASKRKSSVVGAGLLTEQQYQTAVTTAQQLPSIKVERAWFRVQGERFVTPNSLTQLIVKFRFIPPGATNIPEVNEKELKEVSDDDDRTERKKFAPPLANAPYFPRDHSPVWHMFLGDAKMGRIAVPPFTHSTFDKEVITSDGEPTYNLQTIKMQFGAPPTAGNYTFVMHIINDSYLGFDIKESITLTVEDPSRAEVIEDDGEISEPDEGKFSSNLCVDMDC